MHGLRYSTSADDRSDSRALSQKRLFDWRLAYPPFPYQRCSNSTDCCLPSESEEKVISATTGRCPQRDQRIARDRIRQEPAALRDFSPAFVRFGSKADAASPQSHVRFAPKSGQIAGAPKCPLVPKADSCTAATTHAACLSDHLIGGREKSGRGCKARIYSSDNILTVHYSHAVDALFSFNRKSARQAARTDHALLSRRPSR